MKINQVEELVGITKKNIRFYEEQGLLKPERNPENGYREYTLKDVADLNRVKLFRKLAVPVEDIKLMNEGSLSLADCMDKHLNRLNKEIDGLEMAKEICDKLTREVNTLENSDIENYLEEIARLERGDVVFMDIEKKDVTKKKIGPSVAALVVFLFSIGFCGLMFWADSQEEIPLGVMLWIIVPFAAIAVGIVAALFLRLKEIEGGEEDEASKY